VTTFLDVQLRDLRETTVVLDVTMREPGVGEFLPDRAYALMLLLDNAENAEPLRSAMPTECPLGNDPDVATRFIASVAIEWVRGMPRDVAALEERPRWRWRLGYLLPFLVPRARYRITVHDDKWLAQMRRGQTWDSAAYAVPPVGDEIVPSAPDATPVELDSVLEGPSPLQHGMTKWWELAFPVPDETTFEALERLGTMVYATIGARPRAASRAQLVDGGDNGALLLLTLEWNALAEHEAAEVTGALRLRIEPRPE
jgi:hypothetical protein